MPKDKKKKEVLKPMKDPGKRELILKKFNELVIARVNEEEIKKDTDKIRTKAHLEEEKKFRKPLVSR